MWLLLVLLLVGSPHDVLSGSGEHWLKSDVLDLRPARRQQCIERAASMASERAGRFISLY